MPRRYGCSGEHLKELNLVEELFEKFHQQLAAHGYV